MEKRVADLECKSQRQGSTSPALMKDALKDAFQFPVHQGVDSKILKADLKVPGWRGEMVKEPKFRLVSDGKHSYLELCGKSMRKGVSSVSYIHEAGKHPEISISFDLNDFEFSEDGKVDGVTSTLSDREPSNMNGPSGKNELPPIITAE